VTCASCGSENTPGAKFCNECGATLAAGCPTCGAINKPGAKFCNECGTTLGAASGTRPASAVAPTAQQPVAERRLVTVLFADIVGFTPFAEDRDAEDVRDTLSRYFDMCTQIVERYGGTIEKFIGDAVMAVWGTPVAHEDDAERAVRAALELLDAVRTLAPNAQARAGVLSGEAAVTLGATNQGMVAGDLVNTAARLQSVAPAGTALVGEATMRATSGAIVYEEAGEQVLKGKQAPVPAWRAVRVVAERGGRKIGRASCRETV
jgi:Adenylate cyclase, family 3 (some proteins contain HAMP domain)